MKMINSITKIVFLLAVVFFTNCTYAQKNIELEKGAMPDWVTAPYSEYSEQKYIVGVGSGDTRKAAEFDAAGNISRVFKSKIEVDETVVENYLENETELTASSEMLKKTSVNSEQELKNIIIERAYFSEKQGVYYVLAYMDRAETARLYKQDIGKNNKKIMQHYADFESSDNKLHKFAFLKKALLLTDINDILNQQFQILTFGSQVPASVTKNELEKSLMELKDKITVQLVPDAGTPEGVGDYLKEMIGKFGFKMINGAADFTFQYGLDVKETNINRANTEALSWKLTLRVKDNVNNSTLKAFNLKKRTVAVSHEEARSRMMLKVQNALSKKFYKKFNNYILSI